MYNCYGKKLSDRWKQEHARKMPENKIKNANINLSLERKPIQKNFTHEIKAVRKKGPWTRKSLNQQERPEPWTYGHYETEHL